MHLERTPSKYVEFLSLFRINILVSVKYLRSNHYSIRYKNQSELNSTDKFTIQDPCRKRHSRHSYPKD